MHTTITPCLPKTAGLAGLIISVALVFGSDAAIAEGLTGLADPAAVAAGPYGTFSRGDVLVLDRAVHAASTGNRSAGMGGAALVVPAAPTRAQDAASSPNVVDLFPCSGRVLPLLVPRPDAVVQAPRLPRPGSTPAVGVPYPMPRRSAPAERPR